MQSLLVPFALHSCSLLGLDLSGFSLAQDPTSERTVDVLADPLYVSIPPCEPSSPTINSPTRRLLSSASSSSSYLPRPITQDWSDAVSAEAICEDLDETLFVPNEVRNVPAQVPETHVLSSAFGRFTKPDGEAFLCFGFNNITFTNKIYKPILREIAEGRRLNDTLYASATFSQMGGGNLVLINRDTGLDHPYHLHGAAFSILARGTGSVIEAEVQSLALRTENPLRRDVISIPRNSYAVLRVTSDYGAVLALHCHSGWHFAEGKFAVVVTQPDKVKIPGKSSEWAKLCSARNIPQGETEDSFGPAKRHRASKHRLPSSY